MFIWKLVMDKVKIKEWLKTKSDREIENIIMELEGQRLFVMENQGPNSPEMNSINEQFDVVMGEMIRRSFNPPLPKGAFLEGKNTREPMHIPPYWNLLAEGPDDIEEQRNFVFKPRAKMVVPNTFFELMALG
jgi:hypothetical protein